MSSFLDSTPLRDILYNPTSNEAKGAAGANAGLDQWNNVTPSKFNTMDMTGPERAADVSYGNVNAQQMGQNAYNNVNVNPEYQQAQMAQLGALQQLQQQGGMNAQDKANLAGIQQQENQNEAGNRAAILQNAQMRGTGNSGNSLLAQLVSQQGSVNRQNANDLNVAGMAQNRALQAGGQAATLGGNMQQQSFNQQAQQAAAQNAINQFNAQSGNQVNMFNAQQGLGAQEFNTNKNQGVNNLASAAQNQNQLYNNYAIPQAQFGQQAQIAGGMTNSGNNVGNYYSGVNAAHTKAQAGIMSGVGQLVGAAGGMMGGGSSAGGGGKTGSGNAENSAGSNDFGGATSYTTAGESGESTETHAAFGGKMPGMAHFKGDSLGNDTMQVNLSPGEVVVPRSLTKAPASKIGSFVQHAPAVTDSDKHKEAMLSALKQMRTKGGR